MLWWLEAKVCAVHDLYFWWVCQKAVHLPQHTYLRVTPAVLVDWAGISAVLQVKRTCWVSCWRSRATPEAACWSHTVARRQSPSEESEYGECPAEGARLWTRDRTGWCSYFLQFHTENRCIFPNDRNTKDGKDNEIFYSNLKTGSPGTRF